MVLPRDGPRASGAFEIRATLARPQVNPKEDSGTQPRIPQAVIDVERQEHGTCATTSLGPRVIYQTVKTATRDVRGPLTS